MSGRKETRDILADLGMGRGSGGSKDNSSGRHDVKAFQRQNAKSSEIKTKPFKLTSYINVDLNDEADVAVVMLKKKVGKLTKSMLVEEALRICLSDPVGTGLEAALKERNRK